MRLEWLKTFWMASQDNQLKIVLRGVGKHVEHPAVACGVRMRERIIEDH